MRWLLDAAIQVNPELANQINYFTASWCRRLFSYANTAPDQEFVYGPGNAGMVAGINPAELKRTRPSLKPTGRATVNSCSPTFPRIMISSGLLPPSE